MTDKSPKTKAQFIYEFTRALEGELLTHLVFQNDDVVDNMESLKICKHMVMTINGHLTKEVLK